MRSHTTLRARAGGGRVDRQVTLAVPRHGAHVRSRAEQRLDGRRVAEEGREMKGRPAVVRDLTHGRGIRVKLAPDVGVEPERARFEEGRARPAIEEQADEFLLAMIGRDQNGGIALVVAGVREVRIGRQDFGGGRGVAAADVAEQISDPVHHPQG
jgi:hypothetical protein